MEAYRLSKLSLFRHLTRSFRQVRMNSIRYILKYRAVEFKPSSAKSVIFLPHPDDEVFGMGGTIAAKIAAGAECVFVLATWGEKSHCSCCPGTEGEVTIKRREAFYQSVAALGINHPYVIELGLADDGILQLKEEDYVMTRNKIMAILSEVMAQEVYYPAWQDSHPDHIGLSKLCHEAIVQSGGKYHTLRYIVWGWYLPSTKFYKELLQAKILKVDTQIWADRKQCAIDVYLNSPPAPCGTPYCGTLPPILLEACSSTQEFFLS